MRLIKLLSLAALAIAVAAAIGASSASAERPTQLCKVHPEKSGLVCPKGEAVTEDHQTLALGTVWKLLAGAFTILCLNALKFATPLELAGAQLVHTLKLTLTGCGTGPDHDNCTVAVDELPLLTLLKTGLDEGVLTAVDGSFTVVCKKLGVNCLYDLEGAEFSMGGQQIVAAEAPVKPLGGIFLCPGTEATLDFVLVPYTNHYILE